MPFRRIGVLCATLAASCGGSPEPDASLDPGVAELGTGTVEWQALAPAEELDIIAGPQGGHHFIVHARIQDLLPGDPSVPGELGNPITTFSAFVGDEQVDMDYPPYRLGYEDGGDGFHYLASGRLLVLREDRVQQLYDQEVSINVDVVDASGRTAHDERVVTAVEATEIPDAPEAGP